MEPSDHRALADVIELSFQLIGRTITSVRIDESGLFIRADAPGREMMHIETSARGDYEKRHGVTIKLWTNGFKMAEFPDPNNLC